MRLTGDDRPRAWRRAWVAACCGSVLGLAAGPDPVRAEPPVTRQGVTQIALLALGGYDPVSYFLPDGPRPGVARFEMVWSGRAWRFAAEANRAAFERDPEVYAPRLGGFDPAGILDRRLVETDPSQFAIIGERLYVFRDDARRARFLAQPGLAASAEAIWPELRGLLDDPPALPAAKAPASGKPATEKSVNGTLGAAPPRIPPTE